MGLERAGLLGSLAQDTFENFSPRRDWPGARYVVSRVLEYCRFIFSGNSIARPWLVFWGNYGTGKTHLLAAVVHWAVYVGETEVYFKSWPPYLRELEQTFRSDSLNLALVRREELIREMARGRLVAIDDLDKRRPTDWSLDMAFEPLDERYVRRLPTLFAFNKDPRGEEAKAYIGPAIQDRMMELTWDFVHFDGPSLRNPQGFNLDHAS